MDPEKNGRSQVQRLRIISYNVFLAFEWGPFPDWYSNKERAARIVEELRGLEPDIVLLQEIHILKHWQTIKESSVDFLPFSTMFHGTGFSNTGMVILSRWQILETDYTPPTLNGSIVNFGWPGCLDGSLDACPSSGIGMAKILLGHGRTLQVFISHFYPYREKNPCELERVCQAIECSEWLRRACQRKPEPDLVVYGGDFNLKAKQAGHRIITTVTGLQDTYSVDKGPLWTYGHPDNIYTLPGEPRMKIDHIFAGDPSGANECLVKGTYLPLVGKKVWGTGKLASLSDHEALAVDLEMEQGTGGGQPYRPDPEHLRKIYQEFLGMLEAELSRVHRRRLMFLIILQLLLFVALPYLALTHPSYFTGLPAGAGLVTIWVAFLFEQSRWYKVSGLIEKYSLKAKNL